MKTENLQTWLESKGYYAKSNPTSTSIDVFKNSDNEKIGEVDFSSEELSLADRKEALSKLIGIEERRCGFCKKDKYTVEKRELKVPLKVSDTPLTSKRPMCEECFNRVKSIKL